MWEPLVSGVVSSYVYETIKEKLPKYVHKYAPGLTEPNAEILEEVDTLAEKAIDRIRERYKEYRTVQLFLSTEYTIRRGVLYPLFEYVFHSGPEPTAKLTNTLLSCAVGREVSLKQKTIGNVSAKHIIGELIREIDTSFRANKRTQPFMLQLSVDKIYKKINSIHQLAEAFTKTLDHYRDVDEQDFVQFCDDYIALQEERVKQLKIHGLERIAHKAPLKHDLLGSFVPLSLIQSGAKRSHVTDSNSGVKVEDVSAEEAVENLPKVIVRGAAGSGKTTLLQWLIFGSVAKSEQEGRSTIGRSTRNLLPIFIPLRRLEESYIQDWGIKNVFRQTLASRDLEHRIPERFFEILAEKHIKVVFMLDGLDEVSEPNRDGVWKTVESIERLMPQARIVITSRNLSTVHLADGSLRTSILRNAEEYRRARSQWRPSSDFFEFVVLPLSNVQISTLVDRWFDGIDDSDLFEYEREGVKKFPSRLTSELFAEHNTEALDLSRVPLLCALICLVFFLRQGTLPRSRRELYELATDLLVETRDERREVRSANDFLSFGLDRRMSLLRYIALEMQEGATGTNRQTIEAPKHAVKGMVEKWKENNDFRDAGSTEILDFLIERCALIREPALGHIDFIHRSFMEYLAAQELVIARSPHAIRAKIENEQWLATLDFCMDTPQGGVYFAGKLIEELVDYIEKKQSTKRRQTRHWRRQMYRRAAALLSATAEYPVNFEESLRQVADNVLPPQETSDVPECLNIPFIFLQEKLNFQHVERDGEEAKMASAVLLARHEDQRCGDILKSGYQNVSNPEVIYEINRSGRVAIDDHNALLARVRNKSYIYRKIFLDSNSLGTKAMRQLIARKVGLRFPYGGPKFVGWDFLPRCLDVSLLHATSQDWHKMVESISKKRFDKCTYLELEGCTDFNFGIIKELFPNVKIIYVENCRHFSLEGLKENEALEMIEFRRVSQPLALDEASVPSELKTIVFNSCSLVTCPEELWSKGIDISFGVAV